ncbi:right-handed parallel beta-helix repeat-containing protein [Candidatus Bipolaricaulota bacterium]|nr:right-handed parallel beta-helix repeat-containing protein [Candidatus Bipolaricaulota bacterium]
MFSSAIFGLLFLVAVGEVLTVDPNLATLTDSCFGSLSEALLSASPGDTILLAPGRYDPTVERFPINIDKPVTIRSLNGPGETVFVGPQRQEVFLITAPGAELRGITIQHMGTGIAVMADGVRIIENRIELLPSLPWVFTCGVWLVGAREAQIVGNELFDCGLAIAGPRPSPGDIDKPSLTGIFLVGEDRRWFTTHLIEGNLVNGRPLFYLADSTGVIVPETAGQVIIAGCSDITISNLKITDASVGVQIVHSRDIRVRDSELAENSLFGLYIAYTSGCQVSGVQALRNNHGIDLRASTGSLVSGCTLAENEQGLFLSHTEDCLVSNCTISENGVGIFSGSTTGDVIFGSSILGNRHGVLAQETDGLQIVENHIVGNGISGVRLSAGCRDSAIVGNHFEENATNVLLAGTNNTVLWENAIIGAGLTGVYLWDSVGVNVRGNRFSGNALDLDAVGATRGVVLRLNRFVGDGVSVMNEAEGELDARFNWWGTDGIERAAARAEGKVALTPILAEGSRF